MKKIIALICLAVCMAFGMSGCEEPALENYNPKEEEFEFAVLLDKTEYVKGEIIEYTIKVTRKSGPKFSFYSSYGLWSEYFAPIGQQEKPSFVYDAAYKKHIIPKNYKFEETFEIYTKLRETGQYLFAVEFTISLLHYNYETVITIVDA